MTGFVRRLLGVLLGLVARVWLLTLRVNLQVHPALYDAPADVPWVLAFFHGKQWPLLAWKRRRRTAVMVSLSKDGELQSAALSILGFHVVRGSSSRGGARGLASLVRGLRTGEDAAFAVDGPRGPYGVPKPGVFLAAEKARAMVVPMGSSITSGKVFGRAWDRFALAWPFSRVAVVLGAPIQPSAQEASVAGQADELRAAIEAANATAEAILAGGRWDMVRFSPPVPRFSGRADQTHDL